MNNVIEFVDYGNAAIRINRSEEFYSVADELSEYIAKLLLTAEQNNRLVELAVKQVNVTEISAFTEGVELGLRIGKEFGYE